MLRVVGVVGDELHARHAKVHGHAGRYRRCLVVRVLAVCAELASARCEVAARDVGCGRRLVLVLSLVALALVLVFVLVLVLDLVAFTLVLVLGLVALALVGLLCRRRAGMCVPALVAEPALTGLGEVEAGRSLRRHDGCRLAVPMKGPDHRGPVALLALQVHRGLDDLHEVRVGAVWVALR